MSQNLSNLNVRNSEDFIFKAGRLFQEWVLIAWVMTETHRLMYQRKHQKTLRTDSFQNVIEAVEERRRADSLYNNERENAICSLFFSVREGVN